MIQKRREKAIGVFMGEQKTFEDSFYPGDRVTYIKDNLKKPVEVEILQVLPSQTLWVRNSYTGKEYRIYQYQLTERYKFTSRPGYALAMAAC
jgi:CRISPR/Cas system CSM-associated protein Csm5 (group 7 of RAMP superfamily)